MDIADLGMLLESVDGSSVNQREFEEACERVKTMEKLTDDQRLQLYGLFKQSSVGDVNTSKPMMLDFVGCSKWDAWKQFEGMPQEAARKTYVYIVNELLGKSKRKSEAAVAEAEHEDEDDDDDDDEEEEEYVENRSFFTGMGVSVSTFQDPSGSTLAQWTSDQSLFLAVTEENLANVQLCITSGCDVNLRDEEGMSPLHYAADRGCFDIANELVANGALVDAQDKELQTPLMLAAICEHEDIVRLLLDNGADVNLVNSDGESVCTMEGLPEEIQSTFLSK